MKIRTHTSCAPHTHTCPKKPLHLKAKCQMTDQQNIQIRYVQTKEGKKFLLLLGNQIGFHPGFLSAAQSNHVMLLTWIRNESAQ